MIFRDLVDNVRPNHVGQNMDRFFKVDQWWLLHNGWWVWIRALHWSYMTDFGYVQGYYFKPNDHGTPHTFDYDAELFVAWMRHQRATLSPRAPVFVTRSRY